jgi:YVTN family beta-propeller protein
MLVVIKAQATPEKIQAVCEQIKQLGFRAHPLPGVQRAAIGITGNQSGVDRGNLEALSGVAEGIRVSARLLTFALLALPLAGCRPHDFPQYPPNYREYAYVTNGGSGTVTVLDVVNVRLDRELATGQNPVAVAASPTRNEVYVVNSGQEDGVGSVSVINAENNTVSATIQLHKQPVSIELDPTGDLAYVANSGSNIISILDLKSRREIAVIGAGEEPVSARVSPDGKTLVVANRRGNSVSLIDPAARPPARSVRAVFEGCPGAADVVILPDSSKAFIACAAGHQVMVIGLAHSKIYPALPDRLETLMDVGRAPVQLALKPDGGELFVSNSLSGSISEVSSPTDDVLGTYMMGDDPVRGLVSNDNSLLYVSNFRSPYVTIYAIDEGKRIASIHVGDGASALAFSSSGYLLFVVDSHSADVAVVRTASRSLFTLIPTGRNPNAIAVKAFKLP